ncbi:MAG TPA: hypothetical protein VFE96_03160 [Candidatus Bathyarchaeia archaeon]|nr:hypothetical protein [Candidatus Bathyarchaeia archaeon]
MSLHISIFDPRFSPFRFAYTSGPGKLASVDNLSQPQPWYPPPPQAQKSNTTLILVIVLVVIVVVAVVGAIAAYSFFNYARSSTSNLRLPHTGNIVNGLITVRPGTYNYYQFTVPVGATSTALGGSFSVSGGTGNNIEVLVMDQSNYNNWKSGYQASKFYDSGQVTSGTLTASLPTGGVYYLVYSNIFSSSTTKSVQTTAYLYYFA